MAVALDGRHRALASVLAERDEDWPWMIAAILQIGADDDA